MPVHTDSVLYKREKKGNCEYIKQNLERVVGFEAVFAIAMLLAVF